MVEVGSHIIYHSMAWGDEIDHVIPIMTWDDLYNDTAWNPQFMRPNDAGF